MIVRFIASFIDGIGTLLMRGVCLFAGHFPSTEHMSRYRLLYPIDKDHHCIHCGRMVWRKVRVE